MDGIKGRRENDMTIEGVRDRNREGLKYKGIKVHKGVLS